MTHNRNMRLWSEVVCSSWGNEHQKEGSISCCRYWSPCPCPRRHVTRTTLSGACLGCRV